MDDLGWERETARPPVQVRESHREKIRRMQDACICKTEPYRIPEEGVCEHCGAMRHERVCS